MGEAHSIQIKTEQVCSKNSRKYQYRRFRPKMAESMTVSAEKQSTAVGRDAKNLRNKR